MIDQAVLQVADLQQDPFSQFALWFKEARDDERILLPEAACLSTLTPEGFPEGRMVLLKDFDPDGFVFYTNLESRKAVSLREHPKAGMTFHWVAQGRQVRLCGAVTSVTDAEADEYFASRPRGSQVGAWASDQSRPLETREDLEARVREVEARYADQRVPRPSHWSGFRIAPVSVEFWQEGPFRLHDRFEYRRRSEGGWAKLRLNP